MQNTAQKRKRTGGPKVRSGCVTCKKRHVKCDETKPACIKCLTLFGACGGYHLKPRKNQSWRHRLTAHSPEQDASSRQQCLFIVEPSAEIGFENELERLYFEEWTYLARVPLGGHNPSKLWSTYMPQLSTQNAALRNAALSLGAMSQSLSLQCQGQDPFQSHHYENAVSHYCKALKSFSQASQGSAMMQEAMLLSILFTSFEGLRHNIGSALKHISHGLLMIRELCSGPKAMFNIDQLAPDPGQLIGEIVHLFSRLAVQTQVVMRGSLEESNCETKEVDERVKAQDPGSEQATRRMSWYLQPRPGLETTPVQFRDADEAIEYWVATTHRIETLGPKISRVMDAILMQNCRDSENVDRALDNAESSPEAVAFTETAHGYLQTWHDAFAPLYEQNLISQQLGFEPDMTLVSIRIEYLAMSMLCLFCIQGDYDAVVSLTPKCRELNELCEIALQKQFRDARGPSVRFAMHIGLSWYLIFVAINCRDAAVREEAIGILEAYPRQDGLWCSQSLLAIALKNRQIETENDNGDSMTQQWRRLCRRVFLFEKAGEKLVFRYMRKKDEGGWEYVEEYADQEDPILGRRGDLGWKRRPLSSQTLTLQWGRTVDASTGVLWPGLGCSAPRFTTA